MHALLLLIGSVAIATTLPAKEHRIEGGSVADISQYRFAAALLYLSSGPSTFTQACGGTVLTNRAILSAAHCFVGDSVNRWRVRLGSTRASSGGRVYNLIRIIIYPYYNSYTHDSDIAILHTSGNIALGGNIVMGQIAGVNYYIPENSPVWAIGWGLVRWNGPPSDQLRHVQIWTVNQDICRQRYAELRQTITDNMLCSGWLDVGGRDSCTRDSGGPLVLNNVVIGITSWGKQCALPRYPGVYVRVSRFTDWIQANA